MRSFVKKILLFTIPLIILSFIIEIVVEKGLRKSETRLFQTWTYILDSKIESDVLILGNSRAWVHISPQIIDSILQTNSYNIGIDGYPFDMQYFRYNLYEEYNNKKPRLIIQNIDILTIAARKDSYEKEQFFPYIKNNSFRKTLKYIGFSDTELLFPITSYAGYHSYIIQGFKEYFNIVHYKDNRYKGYEGQTKEWDGNNLEKINTIIPEQDPEIIKLFDDFLKYCKQNNIEIVMVYSPQYIKVTESTKNMDEFISLFESLSNKYNFKLLNYTHDELCYDNTYFYNAMHLNKKGAELFSIKLAHDIDSLNILDKSIKK